jgi:hypothetical protein
MQYDRVRITLVEHRNHKTFECYAILSENLTECSSYHDSLLPVRSEISLQYEKK